MEIKMDSEAWGAIASKAIFDSMTQESRDTVIQQAVQYLLTPEEDRLNKYGPKKTPLQSSFEMAIRDAAFKAVREFVAESEEIQTHIQELLGPLVNSALKGEASHYNSHLADAIGAALANWLGEISRKE